MKFRNQFIKYMAPAGDGSEGGSGGGSPEGGSESGSEGDPEGGSEGDPDGGDVDFKAQNAELLKEVMKKKGRIQDLEGNLNQANEALKQFEGVDLELYQTMIQERADAEAAKKQAEEERLKSEGKVEELLAARNKEHESIIEQMRAKHTAELEQTQTRYEELESANQALQSQIEELTVGAAFGNSQFIREDMISAMTPARLRQLYGAHFEPNEKGEVVGYDKPKGVDGRAPIVDSQGNPVSFDVALKSILESQGDIDSLLRNKVAGAGSGSKGSGKGSKTQQIGSGLARIEHALNNQE